MIRVSSHLHQKRTHWPLIPFAHWLDWFGSDTVNAWLINQIHQSLHSPKFGCGPKTIWDAVFQTAMKTTLQTICNPHHQSKDNTTSAASMTSGQTIYLTNNNTNKDTLHKPVKKGAKAQPL